MDNNFRLIKEMTGKSSRIDKRSICDCQGLDMKCKLKVQELRIKKNFLDDRETCDKISNFEASPFITVIINNKSNKLSGSDELNDEV